MIFPISPDKRIQTEFQGVVYFANPPVGDFEAKIFKAIDGDGSMEVQARQAEMELEKEFKGKRRPGKKEWNKMIADKVIKASRATTSMEDSVSIMSDTIDSLLVDWKPAKNAPEIVKENLAPFPTSGKPSQCLPPVIKTHLHSWIMGYVQLSEDEAKN